MSKWLSVQLCCLNACNERHITMHQGSTCRGRKARRSLQKYICPDLNKQAWPHHGGACPQKNLPQSRSQSTGLSQRSTERLSHTDPPLRVHWCKSAAPYSAGLAVLVLRWAKHVGKGQRLMRSTPILSLQTLLQIQTRIAQPGWGSMFDFMQNAKILQQECC